MSERQDHINTLYNQFRTAGDDVMNASARIETFADATQEEALTARRAAGDPDDVEEDDDDDEDDEDEDDDDDDDEGEGEDE